MFSIPKDRRTISDIPLITDNFEVIHFDEIPYLYYGTNKYGTKIIGSLLEEDEETMNLRYVHTLVDNFTFHQFINQIKPYRNLIENGTDVYIIDKNINEKPIGLYLISPDLIPEDYLPLPDYYCPKYNFSIGNDFVLSLHGSLADSHFAFPQELSTIQKNFEKVLNKALDIFNCLNITPTIKQRAYAPGSFQLRFNLSFETYNEWFISQELLYNNIGQILQELIPNETTSLNSNSEVIQFIDNSNLISLIGETLEKGAVKLDSDLISQIKLKFQDIIHHYSEMSSGIGNGYKEIELLAEKEKSKDLIPLSLFNSLTIGNLNTITEVIESNKHEIKKDEEYKSYKICIYSLNTETRVGKALIYNRNINEIMDKVTLTITGKESLEKTQFTESLHLNKWIEVKAMAILQDGKYSKLKIEGE